MLSPAFVLAYHGCDQAVGEEVLLNQTHVSLSDNRHDWLGHGAYFWENNPRRARQWAEFVKGNPQHFKHRITQPFVIGAIINLGDCLDLTDAESLAIVKEGHGFLSAAFAGTNVGMPTNEAAHEADEDLVRRNLDCAVINAVHELRKLQKKQPFDSVRGIFTEGRALYPGAKILEKTHVQICVRDPGKSVFAYFRPRTQG